uniref:WW domain-containing protein n=1 Tax=Lotharella globosa TaxID=91324 RepID=A0A7S4DSL7_9EUKA
MASKTCVKVCLPSGEIRRVLLADRSDLEGLRKRIAAFLKAELFALAVNLDGKKIYINAKSSNAQPEIVEEKDGEEKEETGEESDRNEKEMKEEPCPAVSLAFAFPKTKLQKFWKIFVDGQTTRTVFGYKGNKSSENTNTRDHGSEAAARTFVEKIVRQKRRKGYVDDVPGVDTGFAEQKHGEGLPPEREWSTWVMYIDEEIGTPYYYNAKTGETTWDEPPAYVKEKSAAEWEDRPTSPKASSPLNQPLSLTLGEAISFAGRFNKKTLKIYVEIAPPPHLLMVNKPTSRSPSPPKSSLRSSPKKKPQPPRDVTASAPQPLVVNPFEDYSNPFGNPFDQLPRNQNPFTLENPLPSEKTNKDFHLDEFNPFFRDTESRAAETKNPFKITPLTQTTAEYYTWSCGVCTLENNTVNFCSACGSRRPQPLFGGKNENGSLSLPV